MELRYFSFLFFMGKRMEELFRVQFFIVRMTVGMIEDLMPICKNVLMEQRILLDPFSDAGKRCRDAISGKRLQYRGETEHISLIIQIKRKNVDSSLQAKALMLSHLERVVCPRRSGADKELLEGVVHVLTD